jgi:acetyl-CoA carboxylase biotin carboxyl carrier protein
VHTKGFELRVLKDGALEDGGPKPAEPKAAARPGRSADLHTITAPMLGMFYAADGPSDRPFVEPGSRVEPDTTVCIIEVMKMMNSVPAGFSGTIVEVCAENAQLVEEGAPLFRVAPA